MKKTIILLLIISSLAFSLYPDKITIVPFEYKDFSNTGEPTFNVSMQMNCISNKIDATVSSNGQPVSSVLTFLKYVQYDNQLLSTQSTDGSGHTAHQITGNISFRTGMFVLVMEKSGYAKREAHFYITDCFKNVSAPPPSPPLPPVNTTPPINTTLPLPPSPPVQNQTQMNLTNNSTSPIVPLPNATTNGGNTTGNGSFCPIGFALLFALFSAFIFSSDKKHKTR